jgi:hypothetical protein
MEPAGRILPNKTIRASFVVDRGQAEEQLPVGLNYRPNEIKLWLFSPAEHQRARECHRGILLRMPN